MDRKEKGEERKVRAVRLWLEMVEGAQAFSALRGVDRDVLEAVGRGILFHHVSGMPARVTTDDDIRSHLRGTNYIKSFEALNALVEEIAPPQHAAPAGFRVPPGAVYFERQRGHECGAHALNNAVGRRAFGLHRGFKTSSTFRDARSGAHLINVSHLLHVAGERDLRNDIPEHVMCTALRAADIRFETRASIPGEMEALRPEEPLSPLVTSIIMQGHALGSREAHWWAARRTEGGAWLLLESLDECPRVLSYEQLCARSAEQEVSVALCCEGGARVRVPCEPSYARVASLWE